MNKEIATGHMMRCLSIADEIRNSGAEAIFILADNNACGLLEKCGYEFAVLDTSWKDMDAEIPIMKRLIRDKHIKTLIIDSYAATADYLSAMTELTYTLYIDDLNRCDLSVDVILCYAIYADRQIYIENCACKSSELLLGTDYVPLRKVFRNIPKKVIREKVENILILSGGGDPYRTIDQCIGVLSKKSTIEIHAICGRYSEQAEELRRMYKNMPNIHIHETVDNIEVYMQEADICISAAGTTLYELCACGTPTLSYILADNQIDNARGFDEKGLIPYLGDVRKHDIGICVQEALNQLEDAGSRKDISEKMRMLIDGKGCYRIIKEFQVL